MRYRQLDSIRGLAALGVVFHHSLMVLPEYASALNGEGPVENPLIRLLTQTPAHLLVAGTPAVMLFFVLSGFVLGIAIERGVASYTVFLSQRFIRLFLPFAASILLSSLLFVLVDPSPRAFASPWFNEESWTATPTPDVVAGHLAMLMFAPYHSLNNVMWTLTIEMRVSIALPLIVLMVRTRPVATLVLSFGLMPVAFAAAKLAPVPDWADSWLLMLRVLWLFVAGCALARWHHNLAAMAGRLDRPAVVLLWAVGLGALSLPAGLSVTVVTAGFGAVVVIALVVTRPASCAVLEHPLCLYFGRISYSLYLVHLPVILALVHTSARPDHVQPVLAIAVACSILVADVMYRAVERPCHRFAQALGSWTGRPAIVSSFTGALPLASSLSPPPKAL